VGTVISAPAPASKVAGLAGVVLFSNDAARLARWYRDMIGVDIQEQGGQYVGRLGNLQFAIQTSETPIAPGTRPAMLSYAVANFNDFVEGLAGRGADILGLDESKQGKFAYVKDGDGNPVEIWGAPGS
jgi:catechol-2,3-dioxygenase